MAKGLKFWKMHSLGNDYIVIDNTDEKINPEEMKELSKKLCQRRFSVGADGLLLACKSSIASVKMRIFNADGSEAEMCGNGIRCLAKFCYEKRIVRKTSFTIETLAGIKKVWLLNHGDMDTIRVDMGEPSLKREDIPMLGEGKCVDEELWVDGEPYRVTCLSVGNPHCVLFVDDVSLIELNRIGPKIETHRNFPRRINVDFVQVISPNIVKARVWERGVGETLACGTGACASAVAGYILGKTSSELNVQLPGGSLKVYYNDKKVFLEGTATKVFAGKILSDGEG